MENKKIKILCVDDEPHNLDALERILRKDYNVLKAENGIDALTILNADLNKEIFIIVSDQRMPQMTGVEFLEKSIQSHPHSIRILLTGFSDIESLIEAINQAQIYRYLTKPWEPIDFKMTIDSALAKYNSQIELREKNKKLEAALDELKILDEAKTKFMVLINHELKTPLTSIINYSSLLQSEINNDEHQIYINKIITQTEKLKKITTETLALIQSELHQIQINFSEIKISEVKSLISLENMTNIDNKKINFQFEHSLANPSEAIKTDKSLLKEILNRIIENALRHAPNNSDVKLKTYNKTSRYVFEISNSGPPIPKEIEERIFQPFFINENMMNHSKGLGLGLTLAQSFLKNLNSELKLIQSDSLVTFQFEL